MMKSFLWSGHFIFTVSTANILNFICLSPGSFNALNADILHTETPVKVAKYAGGREVRLEPGLALPPPDLRPLNRRASHSGNLGGCGEAGARGPGEQADLCTDLLSVPRQRTRGSSLPDTITSTELYRLRYGVWRGKYNIQTAYTYLKLNQLIIFVAETSPLLERK